MNKEKISSQEIIDLVASKASVSKRAAEEFLKVLFATVEEALLAGEVVKIKNFGTFKLQWNEPRKSVNVQTGEEIMLPGYHKASFTPDSLLKELVNEPFAHLEPVELGAHYEEKNIDEDVQTEVTLDPLRVFTEHAFEIKSIISEIQALSNNSKAIITNDNQLISNGTPEDFDTEFNEADPFPSNTVEELDEMSLSDIHFLKTEKKSESETEIGRNLDSVITNQESIEPIEIFPVEPPITTVSNQLNSDVVTETVKELNGEYIPNPFMDGLTPLKKRKKWFLIPVVLLFIGASMGLYYLYHPATDLMDATKRFTNNEFLRIKEDVTHSKVFNSFTNLIKPVSKPIKTQVAVVVVPKDTIVVVPIESLQTADSLQIMFDNPRVFTEFIATERITLGSRLARMAERYYGTSDFWVYIYEANQKRFDNPDDIPAGTVIHIPKLDPRLIDADNPRCMKKARELHDLYVK